MVSRLDRDRTRTISAAGPLQAATKTFADTAINSLDSGAWDSDVESASNSLIRRSCRVSFEGVLEWEAMCLGSSGLYDPTAGTGERRVSSPIDSGRTS